MHRLLLSIAPLIVASTGAMAWADVVTLNQDQGAGTPCGPGSDPCVHTSFRLTTSMTEGADPTWGIVNAMISDDQFVFYPLDDLLPPVYHAYMTPAETFETFFSTPRDFPNAPNPGPLWAEIVWSTTDPWEVAGQWQDSTSDPGAQFIAFQLTIQQSVDLPPLTLVPTRLQVASLSGSLWSEQPGEPAQETPFNFAIYVEPGDGPYNEDCPHAVRVFDGDETSGSLTQAENDGSASCGSAASSPDAWYTFTPPCNGVLYVSTCGTHDGPGLDQGMDTVLSIHSGCPGTTDNELACNDDWPDGNAPDACLGSDAGVQRDSAILQPLSYNETVWIRVSHYPGELADGNFYLHVRFFGPTLDDPHVAGDFQGWDPTSDPMTETCPGCRSWWRTYSGLAPYSRHEFKITNGLPWDDPDHQSRPAFNSWFFADEFGNITIVYDGNAYDDGWSPATDRLVLPAFSDPGTWTVVGDFQGWDNANPATAMTHLVDHVYMYAGAGLSPGTHYWKAVVTGSWDSISWDGRSTNTADGSFEINSEADTFRLFVEAMFGTVRAEVVPGDPCAGQMRGDASCNGLVNSFDIDPFVLGLTNLSGWEAAHPGCRWQCVLDINCDGLVNTFDIDPFVECLTGGCPPCP